MRLPWGGTAAFRPTCIDCGRPTSGVALCDACDDGRRPFLTTPSRDRPRSDRRRNGEDLGPQHPRNS